MDSKLDQDQELPEFYDENADEEDEQCIREQMIYTNELGKTNDANPSSDARLSCPACMKLICLDCQRHLEYHNQYRAMFVRNVRVDRNQIVVCKELPIGNTKDLDISDHFQRLDIDDPSALPDVVQGEFSKDDIFFPVFCGNCDCEVGVCDSDLVYHFYHVLPSKS